jgi:ABC-2 type transport system permease protein
LKIFDIAIKDMTRSLRNTTALLFMFGIPLLVTGMFYLMFGRIAKQGEFNLPRTKVVIANLDEGGPKFQVSTKSIPGSPKAHTMGELVVAVLQSDDMAKLLDSSLVNNAASARAAVDKQTAQVAVIIPPDFSRQFADINGQADIEFYQDPTLTIGPGILRAILNQFMDGMSGVKIAINVALDQAESDDLMLVGQVVQAYLEDSLTQEKDPAAILLDERNPEGTKEAANPILRIIGPIMGGMMIFYAFYTGTATSQSILREEEERTLPRLFTTPTPQSSILSGKLLAVFSTVLMQVITLLFAGKLIFGIQWGNPSTVAVAAFGTVLMASSFGIFVNSMLRSTKQGGVVFGGVLTLTGMIGMIPVFAMNSPNAAVLGNTVSLLVPQGWAVGVLTQAMNGMPVSDASISAAVMLAWSVFFFSFGVWRFNRRYA